MIVGWAAVIIVLSDDGTSARATAQQGSSGGAETGHPPAEPTADPESVAEAQWRVHRLRARLAELSAARERAGSAADPDLDREVASTSARLEHARQWLTSAQSGLAASGHEKSQAGRPAGRLARVAEQAPDHQRNQPVLLARVGGRRLRGHDETVSQPEDVSRLNTLPCLACVLCPA